MVVFAKYRHSWSSASTQSLILRRGLVLLSPGIGNEVWSGFDVVFGPSIDFGPVIFSREPYFAAYRLGSSIAGIGNEGWSVFDVVFGPSIDIDFGRRLISFRWIVFFIDKVFFICFFSGCFWFGSSISCEGVTVERMRESTKDLFCRPV